jgi:hypothetical protein
MAQKEIGIAPENGRRRVTKAFPLIRLGKVQTGGQAALHGDWKHEFKVSATEFRR